MKILVIDDTESNLMLLRAIFRSNDYQVHEATTAEEGYEIFIAEDIQLALIDWMLPEMDGIDLVKKIREEQRDSYAYLIMVTGKDGREAMLEGLEAGVDDFVQRPFTPREMRLRVKMGERVIQMANKLQQSQDFIEIAKHEWEATADAITQLVCLLDREGRIIRANRALENWGLAWINEVKGKHLHELMKNVYPVFGDQIEDNWSKIQQQIDQGLEYHFDGEDTKFGHHFFAQFEPIERDEHQRVSDTTFAGGKHSGCYPAAPLTNATGTR